MKKFIWIIILLLLLFSFVTILVYKRDKKTDCICLVDGYDHKGLHRSSMTVISNYRDFLYLEVKCIEQVKEMEKMYPTAEFEYDIICE